MEFQGMGPRAQAKRRAFAQLVEECGGDHEMADDLLGALADDPPTTDDFRRIIAHVREARADIEAERRKR